MLSTSMCVYQPWRGGADPGTECHEHGGRTMMTWYFRAAEAPSSRCAVPTPTPPPLTPAERKAAAEKVRAQRREKKQARRERRAAQKMRARAQVD